MTSFIRSLPISLLLGSLTSLAAEEGLRDPQTEYLQRAASVDTGRCIPGDSLTIEVPLHVEAGITIGYDAAAGRLRVFYPMQFNDLTEGWNWHPEEVTSGRDYYTYKYLPLGSAHEDRGSYRNTDPGGQTQDYPIRWRWDYFFAFDNPYDFYPRDAGDHAGFVAEFSVSAADADRLRKGDLRMSLRGQLRTECLSESTTFWKATLSAPVDFTLKKRYLIGLLQEVRFYDAASGKELRRLTAGTNKQAP